MFNTVYTGVSFASQIIPDGQTQTRVDTSGDVTHISTDTMVGRTGLNSFSQFNVDQGHTANLYVPDGASNLVNLVHSDRSFIDGTLNAIQDGRIGGNVFFLNPHGIVVGSSGVVNVGSLTMATPTQNFMDSFFDHSGSPNAGAVTSVLDGHIPLSSRGLISVQGKIHATHDVALQGGDVESAGEIASGAVFIAQSPDFGDIVNVSGSTGETRAEVVNGSIRISAVNDITHTGSISTDGGDFSDAGDVSMTAGRDIVLEGGSLISARGRGENSSGGDVYIYADRDAEFNEGATIDVRGGDVSGDGGFVELSATDTVRLSGGRFLASAVSGRGGSVLIDPEDLYIDTDQIAQGFDLTFEADRSITVRQGVTISTRHIAGGNYETAQSTGDSGHLTLFAPEITISAGARLLSHATGGFESGDITMLATLTDAGLLPADAITRIEIGDDTGGALIRGGHVTLTATSHADHTWDFQDNPYIGEAAELGTDMTGVDVGIAHAVADSSIVIRGGTSIVADGDVVLSSVSEAMARVKSGDEKKAAQVGFVYGHLESRASITIQSSANIEARGVSLLAQNTATLDLDVQTKDGDSVPLAAAIAVGHAEVDATATIERGALIDADNVSIGSYNESNFSVVAKASAESGGAAGMAAAVLTATTNAHAQNDAHLSNIENLTIQAIDVIEKNEVSSESVSKQSGDGGTGGGDDPGAGDDEGSEGDDDGDEERVEAKGESYIQSMLGEQKEGDKKVDLDERSGSEGGLPDIAGAVTVVNADHQARAVIGDHTDVSALGDVSLIAEVRDLNQHAKAITDVVGGSGGGVPLALSGAVTIGLFRHDAEAEIGQGSTLAARNLGLHSEVLRTFDTVWYEWDGTGSIEDKLEKKEDIVGGFLSGFSSSKGGAGEKGLGLTGSVVYMDFETNSVASIGEDVSITMDGGDAPWNTTYLHDDDNSREWLAPVSVVAITDILGAFGATNASEDAKKDGEGGTLTIGGSYAQANFDIVTDASIHKGVDVSWVDPASASDMNVSADTTIRQFLLTPGVGGGSGYGLNGNFAYSNIDSHTTAFVSDEATIEAADLTIRANHDLIAFMLSGGFNRPGGSNVSASIGLQDITASATAQIGESEDASGKVPGTIAANNLSVVAGTENTIGSIVTESGNSAAVALSMVDINSEATVGRDVNVHVHDTFLVQADNESSFSLAASASAKEGAVAGIAAALLFADTSAIATNDVDLIGLKNVTVSALDIVTETHVTAKTQVEVGEKDDPTPGNGEGNGDQGESQEATGTRAAGEDLVRQRMDEKAPEFDPDSGATGDDDGDESGGIKFPKLGGAVSVSDVSHSARATIGSGVTIKASEDVSVISRVLQAQVHNKADTGVVSQGSKDKDDRSPLSLSAAVVVGLYSNDALASIGDGSDIEARHVGVQSDVLRTHEMEWHKWNGINTIIEKLQNLKTTQGDLVDGYLSGYANSTSSQEDGEYGLAGSVLYMNFDNSSVASIGDDVHLTLHGHHGQTPLSVRAHTELNGAFAAGNIELTLSGSGGGVGGVDGGKVGIGASYAQVNHDNVTEALLGRGVIVKPGVGADRPDISVAALTDERLFLIAPSAGKGAGFGLSGDFALTQIDSVTHATIGDDVDIDAGQLSVEAEQNLITFAITGAFNMAESAGVGVGISIQRVDTDTQASLLGGVIRASGAHVAARTDGIIETISVAGSAVSSKDAEPPGEGSEGGDNKPGDKGFDEVKDKLLGPVEQGKNIVNTAKGAIDKGKEIYELIDNFPEDGDITDVMAGLIGLDALAPDGEGDDSGRKDTVDDRTGTGGDEIADLGGELRVENEGTSSGGASTSGGTAGGMVAPMAAGGEEGSDPKFGLGISGSASVNVVSLGTEATIDGVTLQLEEDDGGALSVTAVNNTEIGAFSGSAALVRANNSSSKWSAAIAGAAAVNDLRNRTRAAIENSTVTGAGDTVVQALAGGNQLAIGIGAAVNASSDGQKAGSAAGSVSVSMTSNEVLADVIDSHILGTTTGSSGHLNVTAYDRATLGTGGGSLVAGGKGGFGAAITYSAIKNTSLATVSGSVIEDFDTVAIHGLTAAKIGAGGAMVGLTRESGSLTLGGAIVVSQIHNETGAEVSDSMISSTSSVDILARDVAENTSLDAVIDARGCLADCGPGHEDMFDFEGHAVRDEDDQDPLPGSSIISVAGVVQGSTQGSNVGLSLTWNDIQNDFRATVTDSQLTSDGDVRVRAESHAKIIGLSLGAGVSQKFSGAGSLTNNMIRNTTLAEIRHDSGTSTSVQSNTLRVEAQDMSDIFSLAGQVNVSIKGASAGFTLANSMIKNQTAALIDGADVTTQDRTSIDAQNDATIMTIAIAGSAALEGPAIGGSITSAHIINTAEAEATSSGDQTFTVGSLDVSAINRSDISSLAGEVAISLGSAAIGGAVVVNTTLNTAKAHIENIDVDATGNVNVLSANDRSTIRTAAVAGNVSKGPAVGGSITVSHIQNDTIATIFSDRDNNIQAGALYVDAKDSADIQSLSGQASVGLGGAGVGAGLIYGGTMNTVRAASEGISVTTLGTTSVVADNAADIWTIGISIGVGSKAAVSGSVAISLIKNETIAEILSGDVTAERVVVHAEDNADIDSISGNVSGAGTAAVGVALLHSHIQNTTRARLSDTHVTASNLVSVLATSASDITAHALVGGVAGSAAIVGSGTSTFIMNETDAHVAGDVVLATGDLTVRAEDTSSIRSLAGSVAGSGTAAVGGAIVNNIIKNTTTSRVSGVQLDVTHTTTIGAQNTSDIQTAAVSGAFAGKVAVSGSVASAHIMNVTEAEMEDASATGGTNEIVVDAKDAASISTLSGAAAGGGYAGVGAAISVNRIANQTSARVMGSANNTMYDIGGLTVRSESTAKIGSLSVGVGGAAGVGVAGSVATNFIDNNTESRIAGGAVIVAQNNVGVLAESHDQITNMAGTVGVGGAVGVGASVSVNQLGGSTRASIDGSTTSVTALALDANKTLHVTKDGLQSVDIAQLIDLDQLKDVAEKADEWQPKLKNSQQVESVRGVAVNALATHSVQNVIINGGIGGSVGAAGTVATNLLSGSTEARIIGAHINRDRLGSSAQSVTVRASDHAYTHGIIGTIGIGFNAGVGAGVNADVFSRETTATVRDVTDLHAGGALNIGSQSLHGASTLVVSGAGSGGISLVGSGNVGVFRGTTESVLANSTVDVGDVAVRARHLSDLFIVAGGAAVAGAAGLAGSVSVAMSEHTTRAVVENSEIDADGDVGVRALTDADIHVISVAGAASGVVAGAASIAINIVSNTTEAFVRNSSIGRSNQAAKSVSVLASDTVRSRADGGSAGIGIAGAGVGLAGLVTSINNRTVSGVDQSSLSAREHVTIDSQAVRDLASVGVSLGAGYFAGVSGAALVILVGDKLEGDARKDIAKENGGESWLGQADALSSGDRLKANEGSQSNVETGAGLTSSELAGINAEGRVDIMSSLDATTGPITSATVSGGSVISAGRDINVTAAERIRATVDAGGAAVGIAGIGGVVGVVSVKQNVSARVEDGSQLISGDGHIVVRATNEAYGSGPAVRVNTIQGSGGIVAIGAAVSMADLHSNVRAITERGTLLTTHGAERDITIGASNSAGVSARAEGYGGGAAAAGAVISRAEKGGTTEALVGVGGTGSRTDIVMESGRLHISADSSGSVISYSRAGMGGLVGAGSGSDARAYDSHSSTARIGDHVFIGGTDAGDETPDIDIDVSATATPRLAADAEGMTVAAGVSVGVSIARALATSSASATIGSGGRINGNSLHVLSLIGQDGNSHTARSFAEAIGGALIGINATESFAGSQTHSEASMGSLMTVSGDVTVRAANTTSQYADVTGIVGGLVAAGFNNADSEARNTTLVTIGSSAAGTIGKDLTVEAIGHDTLRSNAESGSGGVIAGAAAEANTTSRSTTITTFNAASSGFEALTTTIVAKHTDDFNGFVDSVNASVVGGSGSYAEHDMNSRVETHIGDSTSIKTTDLQVIADNIAKKPSLSGNSYNAQAGAGGVVNLSAVKSESDVVQSTVITVGRHTNFIVEGSIDDPGKTEFIARNRSTLHDKSKLDTGGAVAIARSESHLSVDATARVDFGDYAHVDTVGTVDIRAMTDANLHSSANSKTYGLAGAAQGRSSSHMRTTNTTTIGDYVLMRADGDINVGAGRGNSIGMYARTDLYNKTAFPIETDPHADAYIWQDNKISIGHESRLRSVGDIRVSSSLGSAYASGSGTGIDLWREVGESIANAFRKLFGADEISLAIKTNSSYSGGSTGVSVEGMLHAGIHNKQRLILAADVDEDDNVILNVLEQTEGVSFTVEDVNIVNHLVDRLEILNELRAEYYHDPVAVAAYTSEINMILREIQDLGFATVETVQDENGHDQTIIVPIVDMEAPFIIVDNVKAHGGNVSIDGDYLIGSGELWAPNDAEITIENDGPFYLRLNRLTVEERGGHVYFNGASVNSAAEINARQRVSGRVSGHMVDAAGSSDKGPTITVTNNYEDPTTGAAPDVYVTGDITNRTGIVTIASSGSIKIEGVGNEATPNITARTLNLGAGRSIIQSYIDGFSHTATDPELIWGSDRTENSTEFRPGEGARIAAHNVFLSARYLNINGTVQSGVADRQVTIDVSDSELRSLRDQWIAEGRPSMDNPVRLANYRLTGSALDNDTISTYYNPETDEIVVQATKVEGGYIELFGQIMNTGGGNIKLMDGYGAIDVVNNTGRDIVLYGLDTGDDIKGTLRITDTGRMSGDTPITTVYERDTNGHIVRSEYAGETLLSSSTTSAPMRLADGSWAYAPMENQRYIWSTGRDFTEAWRGVAWKDVAIGFIPSGSGNYQQWYKLYDGEERPLRGGAYTTVDPNTSDYTFHYELIDKTTGEELTNRYQYSRCIAHFMWCWEKRYYVEDTWSQGKTEIRNRSIKADHLIPVEFIGYDAGQSEINVTSNGNITLAGSITHQGGAVNIRTTDGSIIQASEAATIAAKDRLNIEATGHIGSEHQSINVSLLHGDGEWGDTSLRAVTSGGHISLHGMHGPMRVDVIDAGAGNIRLDADGTILQHADGDSAVIIGNRIDLVSRAGGIGTSWQSLNVQVGDQAGEGGYGAGLSATAMGDIDIRQPDGDMSVYRVESTSGDVTLRTGNGSLVNANLYDERDERTIAELEQLWEDMQLLGEGAEESAALTVNAYERAREAEYRQYWAMRDVRRVFDEDGNIIGYEADPFDPSVYDPTNPNEAPFYESYVRLHAEFGDLGFDPDFSYTVSQEEYAELTEGHAWTEEQLKYAVGGGILFKQTTSTETRIKTPNVVGHNVTLLAEQGGIGSDQGTIVIDGNDENALHDESVRMALAAAESDDVAVDNDTGLITILMRDSFEVAATGDVVAQGQDNVYLGSRDPIYVDTVQSGGSVRIWGKDGVYSVTTDGPANIQGGRTIIEGGDGGIGTDDNPLRIDLDEDAELTLRAQQDIFVREILGSMSVAEVFSFSDVHLHAAGSILDRRGDRALAIQGASIFLQSDLGAVGEDGKAMRIQTSPEGFVHATATDEHNGHVYIETTAGTLTTGQIVSAGDIAVEAAGVLTIGQRLSGKSVTLMAGSTIGQSIVPDEPGVVQADTLYTRSTGGQSLLGENEVGTLHATNTGGGDIVFRNALSSLTLGSMNQGTGPIDITSAGQLIMAGLIDSFGDVHLFSGAEMTQIPGGGVHAALLSTHSVGGQLLTGHNVVGRFEARNDDSGQIRFINNAQNPSTHTLNIGRIIQHGGDVHLENVRGDLVITDELTLSERITVVAEGILSQTGSGRIAGASKLSTVSTGGQNLTGENEIGSFEAVNNTSGNIVFVNIADTLTIEQIRQFAGGGHVNIDQDGHLYVSGQLSTASGHINTNSTGDTRIVADVMAGGDGDIILDARGHIVIEADIKTGNDVTLLAGDEIEQYGAGKVVGAHLLTAMSHGGQKLDGANTVDTFTSTNTGGDIVFVNNRDLTIIGIDQAESGDVTLINDGDVRIGTVVARQGTADMHVTGSILHADEIHGESVPAVWTDGDDVNVAARFIRLAATGNIGLSHHHLTVDTSSHPDGSVNVSGDGDIYLSIPYGDLQADQIGSRFGDVNIVAANSMYNVAQDGVTNIFGRIITLDAVSGQIGDRTHVDGRRMVIEPGEKLNAKSYEDMYILIPTGDLVSDYMESEVGTVDLLVPDGEVDITRIVAGSGIVLTVLGDLSIDELRTAGVDVTLLETGSELTINEAFIRSYLRTEADIVRVGDLFHTGDDTPFALTMIGTDGLAHLVDVTSYSDVGVTFDLLETDRAVIDAQTDYLSFIDTLIGTRADFNNRLYTVVADNVNRQLFPADLQIYPKNDRFYLHLGPDREITTNALAVNYNDDFIINHFHTENSFVRMTSKLPPVVNDHLNTYRALMIPVWLDGPEIHGSPIDLGDGAIGGLDDEEEREKEKKEEDEEETTQGAKS